ncbi:unnamed protein product [Rhizophagus irregularis]|nr:unnamed protein product [Rhizophagus irregularis]
MTKKRSLLTRHTRTLHSPLSIDTSHDGQGIQTVRSLSHLNSAESIDQIHNRNRLNRSSSLDTEERISRLERGMSSIQEQMSTGFGQITRMLEHELDKQDNEEYIPEKDLHSLQETAQKQYNKKHRKEIKNEIKILIRSAKIDEIPIDYTKKFGEIAPQLEKDLIPVSNHFLNNVDINEILNKNEYHSPEESDPENDPNASTDRKNLFVYKLSWRSDELTNLLHSIDEYVEKYFPENKRVRPHIFKDKFWKNKKASPNLIWWTLKDGKRESPSVHKSIDEESDDESESESEERNKVNKVNKVNEVMVIEYYRLNVDKLDINAESDDEEEGEDEEVIDSMRDQSKKTNKKSSSKLSSQEQKHIHDNVPKRTSKEKEKEQ